MSTGGVILPHIKRARRTRTAGTRTGLRSLTRQTGNTSLAGLTTVIVEDPNGELLEVGTFRSPLDRDTIVAAYVAKGDSPLKSVDEETSYIFMPLGRDALTSTPLIVKSPETYTVQVTRNQSSSTGKIDMSVTLFLSYFHLLDSAVTSRDQTLVDCYNQHFFPREAGPSPVLDEATIGGDEVLVDKDLRISFHRLAIHDHYLCSRLTTPTRSRRTIRVPGIASSHWSI